MTTRVRVLLSILALGAALLLANCGHYVCHTTFGNATCTPSGTGITTGPPGGPSGLIAFLYDVDFSQNGQRTNGMVEQKLNTSVPNFLPVSAFLAPPLPNFPTGLVIVQQKLMYMPSSDGTLFAYSIDLTTGYLTEIAGGTYLVPGGNSIAANAAGTVLFVGDTTGQQISVFNINSGGTLTQVTGSPFATTGVKPAVMTTDGLSKYLYVSDGTNTTSIAAFSIGTSGALSAVTGSPFSFPMAQIAGEKTGHFLLGAGGFPGTLADSNVHVLTINTTTGALTSDTTFPTHFAPTGLSVHPSGTWVYSFSFPQAGGVPNPMEGFTLSSSGTLTEMSSSPFTNLTAEAGPIEQSGQYMFGVGVTIIANGTNPVVAPYAIDQTSGVVSSTITPLGSASIVNSAYAVTDGQ